MAPPLALRAIFAALLSLPAAAQTTWFVDANALPPGNGSYTSPYTSIQYAIDQPTTASGDRIHIFPATYFERLDFEGKSLTLWGIGSGVIVDGSMGPPPQPGTPGSTVTIASGEVAVLENLVIRGGLGNYYAGTYGPSGGGLFVEASDVTLETCTITQNNAWSGAGVFVLSGSAQLIGCSIRQNSEDPFQSFNVAEFGGGIALESAAFVSLIGCDISENYSRLNGGGMYSWGTLHIEYCTIRDNYTHYDGGGAYMVGPSSIRFSSFVGNSTSIDGSGGAIYGSPLIEDSLFLGNICSRGGAIHGSPVVRRTTFRSNRGTTGGACREGGLFEDCLFEENVASNDGSYFGRGGAVYGTMQLRRCIIRNNWVSYGGSFHGYGGAAHGGATLIDCVLYGNAAGWGGAASGVTLEGCTVFDNLTTEGVGSVEHSSLVDCIVWNNHPASLESSTATFSDVQGGWPGVGNIDADPMFWDAAAADFQLKPGSPCIDAGDPASPPDPDGSVADMGALPFDPAHCALPVVYCTPKVNLIGCSPSIAHAGTPSLGGADDFIVTASDLTSQQPGILIWSDAPASLPFYGGTLCVQSPVVRAGIQSSGGSAQPLDCSGTLGFHFSQAYMAQHLLGVGVTLYAQFWMRDSADPLQQSVGLSDGLRFSICH